MIADVPRRKGRYLAVTVMLLLLVLLPFGWFLGQYANLMIFIGIGTMVTVGLCLLLGYTGQVSLGQAAFYGMGAYFSAVLTRNYDVNPWLAMAIGAAATGAAAYGIGFLIFRLRGNYLAMATLGLGLVMHTLFRQLASYTGGPDGMAGIPSLSVGSFVFDTSFKRYYLVWGFTLAALLLSQNAVRSRIGRALRAIHGSEAAAESLGIDVTSFKVKIFVLSAVYASLAGSLFVHHLRFVSPQPFDFLGSVIIVVMAVVGGLASIWGAIFGAATIQLLSNELLLRFGQWDVVIYGLILMLVMIFMPEGVFVTLRRLFVRRWGSPLGLLSRPESRASPPVPERVPESGSVSHCAPHGAGEKDDRGSRTGMTPTDALAPWPASEDQTRSAGHEPGVTGPVLETRALSKAFGGLVALSGVDISVDRNVITAIVGPNGAGKTTLFNLVTGVYPPTDGQVSFNGRALRSLAPHRRAALGIARTFQHVHLFANMSVLENVMIGQHPRTNYGFFEASLRLPKSRRQEETTSSNAMKCLELVGLGGLADADALSLPLGQQKLLAVARALSTEPQFLMLDEPAAGLNATEKQNLAKLIRRIREMGIGVLLVEHDMPFLMSLAEWVIVLDQGKKIAEGTPSQVQKDERVIVAYLGEED